MGTGMRVWDWKYSGNPHSIKKMADDNKNSLVDSLVRTIVTMDDQQGKILLKAFLTWFLGWKIKCYPDVNCQCDQNRSFGVTLSNIEQ